MIRRQPSRATTGPVLVLAPYHLGRLGVGVGAGPERLAAELEAHDRLGVAAPRSPFELGRIMDIAREVAAHVRAASAAGRRPLVLAGECMTSVGTLAGLRQHDDVGVIWLDAHADFNTPSTTHSGFLDGTALATVTGRCWDAACADVPGWRAVTDDRVVLAGARDMDPAERLALQASGVVHVPVGPAMLDALGKSLDALARRVSTVYLHIDLDVLDPSDGRANAWSVPGGVPLAVLEEIVDEVRDRMPIASAALTSFDPSADPTGAALEAARRVAARLIGALGPER